MIGFPGADMKKKTGITVFIDVGLLLMLSMLLSTLNTAVFRFSDKIF